MDFVCAIFVLGRLPYLAATTDEFAVAVVIYNFFAFAFQVPLGYLLDQIKVYKYVSIIGFCLIGLCYYININNVFILATVVGIGNALFHLEGGVNIYSISGKKAFLNGLFVSPGALGIFLGTMFHNELIVTKLPIALIVIAILLLVLVQGQELGDAIKEKKKKTLSTFNKLCIVSLIGLSIIVRSIGGSAIVYSWKTGFVLGIIYTLSIVIGKAFGGLLADKFGFLKVALLSLTASIVCLILGYNIHAFAYVGILLFNIPMSITLTILENTLSKRIACAVGLNTMFLFIGYVICFIKITINNNLILVFSILIAMISIYFAYKLYLKGEFSNERN